MDLHPYYPLLARTPLLRGMRPDELDTLLDCFAPRVRRYARDEILLLTGYETREVGILLEGSITAVKSTPDGASVAITHMSPGGLFGDVLSGSVHGGRRHHEIETTQRLAQVAARALGEVGAGVLVHHDRL